MVSLCPGVTALKNYEEEVVDSLLKADLDCLSREASEIGVILQNVRDDVECMDWDHVPRPSVIRYLLMHVYRATEDNPRLYERWLHVLSKHVASVEMLDKVRQSYALVTLSRGVSAQTMRLAEGIEHDETDDSQLNESVKLVAGAKRPRTKNLFTEQHVSTLTKILTPCASKWEELRIILGLPDHIRKDLQLIFIAHSSIACFSRLLREWIVGGHDYAKDPTLENLEEALRSEAVGLGSEANQLQKKIHHSGITFTNDEEPTPQKKPRLENWPLDIAHQSCDTIVTEGKSILLEVQAVTSGDSSISYQWFKGGCCLGEQFRDNILCIGNSDLSSKGTYTCQCTDGSAVSSSRPILLTVKMSPMKKVLVDTYSNQPEVPEDSWPPAGANTYINLAIIKPGNIERAGEYARNTVQGNIDDIMADKESIEYDTVFTNFQSATRLLIEGRPGSGKTTLVHRFSRDWASGNPKLNLKNIRLLFLVHLRGFFNNPHITLRDIIKLYSDESTVDTLTHEAKESSGEGLCFILDGLDEYRPKSIKDTFIFKLIKRLCLPNSVVIIASRPAASVRYRNTCDKKIEVIGFLKAQVHEYVEKYPFTETGKRKDLHKYLDQHPNVHHMCYLPIHTAMVCYLFNIMSGTLPRTETEMYTDFTTLTLLRTIRRKEDDDMEYSIMSAEDLTGDEKGLFLKICQLGFEKTLSSKQVMRKDEVSDFFKDVHCGKESMGLITVDCMARKCGFENLYTFLHLTFQEYLAAYYIFKSSMAEQLQLLRKYGKKRHMQVVWKFYCGLTSFEEKDVRFLEIMKCSEDDHFGVQCAFESQQSTTCDYVVQSGESGALSFQGHFLTPSDLTAIGYVLNKALCPVKKLVLDRCKFIGMEGLNAFLDEAGDRILSVKTLCFHGKICVMEQYQLLNSCLQRMASIEEFDVTNTNFGSMKLSKLTANNLTLPNLQTLKVSTPEHITKRLLFNSNKVEQIVFCDYGLNTSISNIKERLLEVFGGSEAAFLNSMSRLAEVDLKNRKLEESDVMLVVKGLRQQACCTSLDLSNCCIGDGGCEDLANGLIHCSGLREFFLCKNKIGDCGARALARLFDILSKCGSATVAKPYLKVDMSYNHIGDSGALSLAESLKQLANLKQLDLKWNKIGDKGAIAIIRAIKDRDCLLQISNHRITERGSRTIVDLKADADNNFHVLNINSRMSKEAEILLLNMQDDEEESNNIKHAILNIGKSSERFSETVAAIVKCCHKIKTLEIICTMNFMITETEALKKCTELCLRDRGANCAMALAMSLQHCNSLETLNLEENYIGDDGAKALAGNLRHCNKLQTLNLEGNNISTGGAKILTAALQDCNNLQKLNLGKSNIGADGFKVLLQQCNNFHTLSLRQSHIGGDSAVALAEGIQHCRNLLTLNLEGNDIGNDGIKALAKKGLPHCNNLQSLNLEENGISGDGAKTLAEGLQFCNNLQTLDLWGNDIGDDGAIAIAEGVQHCNNLHTLNLGNNNIGNYGAKTLAVRLQLCSNLQTLNLSGNEIDVDVAKDIAKSLQQCNILETLNLWRNNIGDDSAKALAEGMQHCNYLETLNLEGNYINDDGAKALAEGMQHCNDLQTLNLGGNSIGNDGAKALADGMQHCNDLQTLNFGGSYIYDDGVKALAEGMQHCNDLQTLNFGGSYINDDGVKALAEGMQHCNDLQTLNFGGSYINDDGVKALAEGMQHCNDLQTLNFGGSYIYGDGVKALAEGMQHCNDLQTLNFGGSYIYGDGVKALAEGMQHCNDLQTLNFEGSYINNDGVKALAEGMQHCNDLQTLNFGGSYINYDGVKALAEGMQHCNDLQTLNFEGSYINNDGVKALAEGMQHCNDLQTLNFGGSYIYGDGVKALAEGMQHCNDLQTLNFGGNYINNDGVKALAEGMQHCNHLQTLNLGGNSIGNDGARALAEGMQHCNDLQTLNLGGNSIGNDGAKALAEGMQHCNDLQTLNLEGNNIGDNAVKVLAEGMLQYSNLQTLNLEGNDIGNDCAKAQAALHAVACQH